MNVQKLVNTQVKQIHLMCVSAYMMGTLYNKVVFV